MNKPPDKDKDTDKDDDLNEDINCEYRTIKVSLKKIIKKKNFIPLFNDPIQRTNKLTTLVTHFIKSFILYKYNKSQVIPSISKEFIKMAFKTVAKSTTCGRPAHSDNKTILGELNVFWKSEFLPLLDPFYIDISAKNLSYNIGYQIISILTDFLNNIKEHFYENLLKYILGVFRADMENEIKSLTGKAIYERKSQIKKDLIKLRDSLFNSKDAEIPAFYTAWATEYKSKILPKLPDKKQYEDLLATDPECFLPHMIFMANELQKVSLSSFQIFPLRSSAINKYVRFDASSLVALFLNTNANLMSDISNQKDYIWSQFFKINSDPFKQKGYTFADSITTDGLSVSILFQKDSNYAESVIKKQKLKTSRIVSQAAYKTMTSDEKAKYQANKKIDDQKIKEQRILENREKQKENKEKFKELTDEEKNLRMEFPYIEKLSKENLDKLKNKKLVYIDPGKRCLYYMIGNNFTNSNKLKQDYRLRYTNNRRINETKRFIYQKDLEKRRKSNGTQKLETDLSKHDKKTCDYHKFRDYIKDKFRILTSVYQEYQSSIYYKYRWYGYINEQRANARLIKEIKTKFGKNAILIMGDWSDTNRLKFMSTPGISLKRKLAKVFKVYNLDEFRTSLLHNCTEEKCENIHVKRGDKERKVHAVLTSKMSNKREGRTNRDLNSVLNMRKIVQHLLKTGTRPWNFRRTTKNLIPIKDKIPVNIKLK